MNKIAHFLEPWLQLVIITTACWTGGIFTTAVFRFDSTKSNALFVKLLLVGVVVGFLVALGQSFVLRGVTVKTWQWMGLLAVWALLATTPMIRHKTSGGPTRWWD